jgi:GWxTD domain-containing protein
MATNLTRSTTPVHFISPPTRDGFGEDGKPGLYCVCGAAADEPGWRRERVGMRLIMVAVVTILMGVSFPSDGISQEFDTELKKWMEGPVRYLATRAEIKAFRLLETDEARAGFIETFWSRRDPTPETLINEHRQLLWERVQEANRLFIDSTRPGWRTDRGRIYILYGPPSQIEQDIHADTEGLPTAGRGLIRWIYEGRPGERRDLDPVVIVPFVRDMTGEYRISYDPKLSSVFFDVLSAGDPSSRPWETWLPDHLAYSRSPLAIMLDLGKLQELPSQEEVLLERVDSYEAFVGDTLPVALHRYRHQTEGGHVISVTAALPEAAGSGSPALIARFVPGHPSSQSRILGEDSFRVEGEGAVRLAQARLTLAPDTYDVTVLVVDPGSRTSSLFRTELNVEDPAAGGIQISDITLARALEPLPYTTLASYDEPFVVGGFRVVPRVDASVPRGESMALFYEVYGGQAPYRVTYRLEGRKPGGEWKLLGPPVVQDGAQGAQGWEVPTAANWPLGEYRVRVLVEDAGGAATDGILAFDLVAGDGA